jgi:orotidine-5'-phosphate decarboxylase
MINVHASGGVPMMQAAGRAAADAAGRNGRPRPLVIAVTVLTSMDDATLRQTGVERPLLEQVVALARLTQAAGLDGVVASAQETAAIRAACGPEFQIVTPGIRGAAAGAERNDQSRTMGPVEAIRAGASYLVVGRPIIAAADPKAAAEAIVRELGSRAEHRVATKAGDTESSRYTP